MRIRLISFAGALALISLLASSAPADRIVVGHDVNTLSSSVAGPNEDEFAVNIANWLTGATSGAILAVESSPGDPTRDYAPSVQAALATAGFSVTYISSPAAVSSETLTDLKPYSAVFVGETYPVQTSISPYVLSQYVDDGGNVYMFGGVDDTPAEEAPLLNPFLQSFGLAFDAASYNGLTSVNITSMNPIFKGLTGKTLGAGNGQDIHDLGTDPNASIVQFQGQHGVYAAVSSAPVATPEPSTFLLFAAGFLGMVCRRWTRGLITEGWRANPRSMTLATPPRSSQTLAHTRVLVPESRATGGYV